MKRAIAAASLLLMSLTPAYAAGLPVITHAPLTCIPTEKHAKIVARIAGAGAARVYFRAQQLNDEYYVEMLKDDAGNFWTPLPLPESQTDHGVYRIVAQNDAGEATSPTYSVPVTASCSTLDFSDGQMPIAHNMVIGWMQDERKLKGWQCTDVVTRITPQGDLKRYEECAPAAYIPPVVIAGAATAGAVIGIIASNPKDDIRPVSPARPVVRP